MAENQYKDPQNKPKLVGIRCRVCGGVYNMVTMPVKAEQCSEIIDRNDWVCPECKHQAVINRTIL